MEKRVYRVLYVVKTHGQSHPALTDLIFDGSKPIAVLAWTNEGGRRLPLVSVPLEAADLSKFHGEEADYVYSRTVEGPSRR